ncbi:MAG: prolipoprotein diacylglyceryl transferase [Bacteroidaceae bacterium]|nr:prolipoprotein diacylglyceryl transferase [Bacteroidaceae bacterium]
MLPEFVYWNPDPVIFHVLWFTIRWYALCWAAALLLGYFNMGRLFRHQGIPDEVFSPLFVYCFLGVLIGARLGHCLFYEPGYYLSHITEMLLPIRRIAGAWRLVGYEGLSSHGGIFGMLFAIWLYSRRTGVNILRVLDDMGLATPLSAACIRMGNLFNSEIVGYPTEMPWGFVFAANGEDFARHPAQLYESLFYVLVFIVGLLIYRHGRNKERVGTGFFFGWCLTAIFAFRILIEFIKVDQVDAEAGMLLNIGQLLSIPFLAVGLYCMLGGKYCLRYAENPKAPKYKPLSNKKK